MRSTRFSSGLFCIRLTHSRAVLALLGLHVCALEQSTDLDKNFGCFWFSGNFWQGGNWVRVYSSKAVTDPTDLEAKAWWEREGGSQCNCLSPPVTGIPLQQEEKPFAAANYRGRNCFFLQGDKGEALLLLTSCLICIALLSQPPLGPRWWLPAVCLQNQ